MIVMQDPTGTTNKGSGLAFASWNRCLAMLLPHPSEDVVEEMWGRYIAAPYAEPHRYYHTMTHLEEMLSHFLQYQSSVAPEHCLPEWGTRRLVVELAILFHDVVYDPKRNDNEERSVDWFRAFWGHIRELASQSFTMAGSGDGQSGVAQRMRGELIWDDDVAAKEVETTVEGFILCTKSHMAVEPSYLKCNGDTHEIASPPPDLHLFLDLDLAILGSPAERYKQYAADVRREYGWYSDTDFARGRSTFLQNFLQCPQWYKTKYFCDALEETGRANVVGEVRALMEQLR
uniref:Uncharacterized protein TCIL3000_11_12120 n=1 Tax=Trypanosoma congolense (strain IL3000) TaxID=1068625 RepID=G0V247_TRYCI|nr:unnamed protein product [Trypanosoma congolense IL3000]